MVGWARLWATARRDPRTARLRQGAWYPVVSRGASRLVLRVPGASAPIAVAKHAFEFRRSPPARFTVVYRSAHERAARALPPGSGSRVYAVCPRCTHRVDLGMIPLAEARCPACDHAGDIAWWETG